MKKVIYAAFLGLFFLSTAYSQDVITKSNGDDINAKIIEITQTEIKYRKFDHLDGPIYTLSLNDVFMVRYENGTKEVFSQNDKTKTKKDIPEGVRPGMSYKELKGIYDYNLYTPQYSDPHNLFAAGICSFFIPGLGQMISGEVGRGFGFLGGSIASTLIYGIGGALVLGSVNPYDGSVNSAMAGTGSVLAICGLVGLITIDIYSIVDAVRVAKVKNMYMRDLQGLSSFELKLSPYIQPASIQSFNTTASVGFSLKATF